MLRAEGISWKVPRPWARGPVFLLQRMDFPLVPGSMTELSGPTGGGKSTLLRILAGLLRPDTGTVYLDNEDLYRMGDRERSRVRNRRIGYLPPEPAAIPALTVLENVMLPRLLYGEEGDARQVALTLLDRLGLAPFAGLPGELLSGGERRRMAAARGLVQKPEVLLADNPAAGLDHPGRDAVLCLLRQAADSGAAVLVAAREGETAAFCDHACRLEDGLIHWIK